MTIAGQETERSVVAFHEVLKSSLWGRPIQEFYFKGLNRKEWVEIFKMSSRQTVEGHLADAIQILPQALLLPQDLLLKWIVRLQHIDQKPGVQWMKEYILRTGNSGFYDPLNPDINNPGGRVSQGGRLMNGIKLLYLLAPMETLCFPFVHLFSKVHH